MNQNKHIIFIFVFALVISFLIPTIVLYLLEDNDITKKYVKNENMSSTYKLKSDNIIIKTIFTKYNNKKYKVTTTDKFVYQIQDEIKGNNLAKFKELENIGMIKNSFFEYIKSNDNMIVRINCFEGENLSYSKTRLFLPNDEYNTAFMSFELEDITKKVISLKLPKEYININKSILNNYIKYLGLEDDTWNFDNNSIKSLSNHIEIRIENINNYISIYAIPYT